MVYHVFKTSKCIHGNSDKGGENGNGKEENDVSGGGERLEFAWVLVCK